MKPILTVKQNLKTFEDMINSIADGSFDDEVSLMLLQIKCKNIQMETEIYLPLYPESTWPCLKLYNIRIAEYVKVIRQMEEDCFGPGRASEMPPQMRMQRRLTLQRLHTVYGVLHQLKLFIEGLLAER